MNQDKMISDEANKEKEICEKELINISERIRSFHVNNIDISKYYNLPMEYEKYQVDDTSLRYKLNYEIVSYKIDILKKMINDLNVEKEFIKFKLEKEQSLNQNEYQDYVTNIVARNDYINRWWNEFNK